MMSILRYDEAELVQRLQTLPNRLRVAFAAACAERQLPNYLSFSVATGQGHPSTLTEALDLMWDDSQKKGAAGVGFSERLEECMDLLPKGHQETLDDNGFADDAVMTVVYAIRARLTCDPHEAAYAAYVAYSALVEFVSQARGMAATGRLEKERILAHPLVQAEFRRQRTDLTQLKQLTGENGIRERDGLADLRRRAQHAAKVFFGPSSAREFR
jgi:uncharacterized protein YjaG (DUF416 family)